MKARPKLQVRSKISLLKDLVGNSGRRIVLASDKKGLRAGNSIVKDLKEPLLSNS
jgi:hypothetical protein